MKKIYQYLVGGLFVGLVVLLLSPLTGAQELTQGFTTDESLRRGMIVGLVEEDNTKVESIANDEIDRLYGVVVDANDAPFSLSDDESSVFVSVFGRYEVLVSDINGPIKAGDNISLSNISGFGQKATEFQTLIVGKGLQDFIPSEGSEVLSSASDGAGGTVNIGRILVDVGISKNPNQAEPEQNAPDFLRKAGELIAGKQVSDVRLYISLVILIIVAAIVGSLLYASVRSSITAIGRNPLSKKSITKSLIQVVIIAFLILLTGLFAVYLILRL